jgi:alpha,alpha-trehalase
MSATGKKTKCADTAKWARAFIFDLDGVVTDTAEAHAAAWKEMFDEYLQTLETRSGKSYTRFDRDKDYLTYVDGKPRYEGVKSFLESRGIRLDLGSVDDPPERETVCGLGNRKNQLYKRFLDRGEITVYPEAPDFIRRLRSKSIKTAIVSSSKNCKRVLAAAGISDLFDTRVDGEVSQQRGLKGKPDPDIFLEAAEELDVAPGRAVVLEDAISGVQAGRSGGFACVIGVDRTGGRGLEDHGADRVVSDLSEIDAEDMPRRRKTAGLRSALDHIGEIGRWLNDGKAVFFLDYDGTLTPIVERPEDAALGDPMRDTLKALAAECTVAIVSGRGLADVRKRVGLAEIYYAGSHGFEIDGPGRQRIRNEKGTEALPELEAAEEALLNRLKDIRGAQVERKKYSIAVHYRRVAGERAPEVEKIVDAVLADHGGLRKGRGKKVFELQPDIDWDKGRAVVWLQGKLGLGGEDARPVYIGDDVTDEDAFAALKESGVGIVVHGGEHRFTHAGYGLTDPEQVQRFLAELTLAIHGGD